MEIVFGSRSIDDVMMMMIFSNLFSSGYLPQFIHPPLPSEEFHSIPVAISISINHRNFARLEFQTPESRSMVLLPTVTH